MKTICLYFEIHQIIHLKRYRFFDIGTDHYYYDDYENERSITDIAERSYMPALNALHDMINEHGKFFKVAFSLSGTGIEQLEMHAPQVLEKLQAMNETGCVEFLAEPYSHGLSSLANPDSFAADVKKQVAKIEELFGKKPTVLRNSEGAKHVLGWKSPHYVYHCNQAPNLKLLLRDIELSDDISLRFNNSEWEGYPLFADAYIDRIARLPEEEKIINIFMELSALGIAQPLSSNILEFLQALPAQAKEKGITFSTPTEICKACKSVSQLDVPREAFNKLYSVADRLRIANDPRINQDWDYLQASNNFRFMTTKPSNVGLDRGIYSGPFDAFTNYMNILGDFINRVNALYPLDIDNDELEGLLTTIKNQGDEIEMKDKEITRLKAKIEKLEGNEKKKSKAAAKPAAEKKPAAKKAPAKKAEAKK